ncbi:hypothetical protein CCOS865_02675 [Pseudomonas reidholzensis]|uniref:Uncharacterized protein n=1 Tax=Pseudomonas reidholzensis TaxID=1785162 RepID=A0A383RTM1_9PSED|nr:hypothetical protein [Pseudomonas reidholzensis]SYX90409.1 hypothetical protein CCOS865_02675 [Pseudomonas reidholzensis]
MKFNTLLSRELPGIDEFVKGCVNEGQWLLFKSGSIKRGRYAADFYLKADEHLYALGRDGRIIEEVEHGGGSLRIDELYYFFRYSQASVFE